MSGSVPSSTLMRTYGRVTDPTSGARFWVQVQPDANGFMDSIYLTALVQVLKLNYGESPFYGDWGLPAAQSIAQQVPPDYYVMLTQQRFAKQFMALAIAKRPTFIPTYDVTIQFKSGAKVSLTVIPQGEADAFGNVETDQYGNPVQIGTQTGRFVAV